MLYSLVIVPFLLLIFWFIHFYYTSSFIGLAFSKISMESTYQFHWFAVKKINICLHQCKLILSLPLLKFILFFLPNFTSRMLSIYFHCIIVHCLCRWSEQVEEKSAGGILIMKDIFNHKKREGEMSKELIIPFLPGHLHVCMCGWEVWF